MEMGHEVLVHQHSLEQQGVTGRKVQPVSPDHPEDVVDHRSNRDLAHRPAVIACPQVLDVTFQGRPVDMTAGNSQLEQRIDLAIRVLAGEGEQRPDQLVLDA